MLTRLLIALGALTITAAPALAVPLSRQSQYLLDHHRASGGMYYIDSELCNSYNAYGLANMLTREVHICVKRHTNGANLGDTVRHEVWHVIQACNNGEALFNEPMQAMAEADRSGWPWQAYQPDQWVIEAEAHNMARDLNEREIARFYNAYCN